MQNAVRSLQAKYIIFIALVITISIVIQGVMHSYLSSEYDDAGLINVAGRQRMLSQRITKIALLIQRDQTERKNIQGRLDSLRSSVALWRSSHAQLLKNDKYVSSEVTTLMKKQTVLLEQTSKACLSIIADAQPKTVTQSLRIIEGNDLPFLLNMQRIVFLLQRMAEQKIVNAQRLELGLGILSMIVIIGGFIFILRPSVTRLRESNVALITLNADLAAQQEENTANFEHILKLQSFLEEKEKQYRGRVEEAPDMIYETDLQGRYTYVNPSMTQLSGYPKEKLLGMRYDQLIAPEYRDAVVEFYRQQVAASVEHSYHEFPVVTANGKRLWIAQTTRLVFQNDGGQAHCIGRDITELKESRESLRLSQQRFKSFADNSPVGVHEIDQAGNVVYVNRKWLEISGVSADASPEERRAAVHPDDRERTFQVWKEAFVFKKTLSIEFRFVHPVRGIVWVISHLAPIINEKGEFNGYIGSLNDITHRIHMEQALKERQQLYQLLSENTNDLIALHHADGTYKFISRAFTTVLGYEPDELLGKSPYFLISPADHERLRKHERDVPLDGNRQVTFECELRKKDGSYLWVETSLHPIFDEQRSITSFQSSSRDITQRKNFESALTEARNKAVEANNAKSQFLSMISHEIRTPMNAVIGLTNFMIADYPTGRHRESLDLLKFSGENLLAIINDILDFSKIEAGKIEIEQVSFDLQLLLQNVVRMMTHRAQPKGIQLDLIVDSALPQWLEGDPVRLNQVLINLIGNALKFTDAGSVKIDVAVNGMLGNNYAVMFAVSDTGIGIEESQLQRIFDRFTQASKDTTRKFGGTGLGLAITKNLISLMGGEIKVTSIPGQGSRFYFTIEMPPGAPPAGKKIDDSSDLHDLNQYAVLLVEDNPVNQVVAANFLRKWGMQVTIANDGVEALEKIVTKEWDIILMDMQMPRMDGYTATSKIRTMNDQYFKDVPILALTASAMISTRQNLYSIGISDFVTKPFEPDDLLEKVKSHLNATKVHVPSVKSIDLSLYTHDAPEANQKLASLMVQNLEELMSALGKSDEQNDLSYFHRAVHKTSTTVAILNDTAFADLIKQIDAVFVDDVKTSQSRILKQTFLRNCQMKIDQLREVTTVA